VEGQLAYRRPPPGDLRQRLAGLPVPGGDLRAAGQARSVAAFTFTSVSVHLVFIWGGTGRMLMRDAQAPVAGAARAPRASSWWMWP
jgi:hypothetical protein